MTRLNPDLHKLQSDDLISLNLNNGYNHHIDLRPPRFTYCSNCYEEQVYHIVDDVCVACGYSKSELD